MAYVVAGVSGHTGRVVAETLLAGGSKVRVVVRDAAKGEPWAKKGAEVAIADLGDEAALAKALAGATGAYLLVPPIMGVPDMRAAQAKTLASIAAAVKASAVPHVVLLSSIGAQHAAGTGPIVTAHRAEQALRAIPGTASTFVRATYFMENIGGSLGGLAHGVFPTFLPAAFAHDMVATHDIGTLAASLLVEGPKGTRHVNLAGPRTYSANDVAAALTRLTGKTIAVAEAPLDTMAKTLEGYGFTPDLAGLYHEMTAGFLSGLVAWDDGPVLRGKTELEVVLKPMLG